MPRTVVLEHTLPGGTRHFDWLMEASEGGPGASDEDRSLLAFRVSVRVDDPSVGSFRAEAMPDHRRLYLRYEGEIAGGRGRVLRVAEGICKIVRRTADEVGVEVEFAWRRRVLVGRRLDGVVWEFEQESS